MESLDQFYLKVLRTSKGGLPWTSSLTCGIKSSPKGSWILGGYSIPANLAFNAIFFRKPKLLQSLHRKFAIFASVLYELREADFFKISREHSLDVPALKVEKEQDPGSAGGSTEVVDRVPNTGDEVDSEGRTRWEESMIAFTMLKAKITGTPILKHLDP